MQQTETLYFLDVLFDPWFRTHSGQTGVGKVT
jgi:hypothetical protein